MQSKATPPHIIAETTRLVIQIVERLCGDRVDYPLLVASGVVYALSQYQIKSQIMYGKAAWIEVLENDQIIWAGCWGESTQFWVINEYQELIDLNAAVGIRKRAHNPKIPKSKFGPPVLWSNELPSFFRYEPEGVAELDLLDDRDNTWFQSLCEEIDANRNPSLENQHLNYLEFPDEPILCSGRKILDNTVSSFASYDRSMKILGIPESPF